MIIHEDYQPKRYKVIFQLIVNRFQQFLQQIRCNCDLESIIRIPGPQTKGVSAACPELNPTLVARRSPGAAAPVRELLQLLLGMQTRALQCGRWQFPKASLLEVLAARVAIWLKEEEEGRFLHTLGALPLPLCGCSAWSWS